VEGNGELSPAEAQGEGRSKKNSTKRSSNTSPLSVEVSFIFNMEEIKLYLYLQNLVFR
jgi:hypothetical protein